jgi:N-acetyl-gamma-glutamyl-phosphate reductase
MTSSASCHVKIVGVSGYSGGELLRILLGHPHVTIASVTAFSLADPTPVSSYWPRFRGECDLVVEKEVPGEGGDADFVFLCTPHGESMNIAPAYLEKGYTVIDLSADYRFADLSEREGYYVGLHTSPEYCAQAVYGMPELFRDQIRGKKLIANPGCYPTGIILSLYPAVKEGLIMLEDIHISSASGVTGAGKKPKPHLHHPELDQNFFAYRVGNHQHSPEIHSVLHRATGQRISVSFVPHVLPIQRGILSTIFCKRRQDISLQDIWKMYERIYEKEPFIRLYPVGHAPDLQSVRESNFVDISIHEDMQNGTLIFVAAEDNLTKGAAGQAVQNMNLLMGYSETSGLLYSGV